MSEKKLASDYFMEGLNCAESVIKAYNEEFGTDIPIRVASGLGGVNCARAIIRRRVRRMRLYIFMNY